jgi:hypothetical protein
MPSLPDIVDTSVLNVTVPIQEVKGDGVEGAMVNALAFGQEGAFIQSKREWVLHLDTGKILDDDSIVDLVFPSPLDKEVKALNQSYKDVELIEVPKAKIRLGTSDKIALDENGVPVITGGSSDTLWGVVVFLLVVLAGFAIWVYRKMGSLEEVGSRASEAFAMPEAIDPFIACKWLRAFSRSDLVSLTNHQHLEIKEEITEIESSCFDPSKIQMDEHELRETIKKWLKLTH